MHGGVLQRSDRAEGNVATQVKIVPGSKKAIELNSISGSGREALQARAPNIVVVVAAAGVSIEIKTVGEIGSIDSPTPAVDRRPAATDQVVVSVSVSTGYTDCKVIGHAVIDPDGYSRGSEIVAGTVAVAVHIHKVTVTSHEYTPAILCRWR